MYERNAIVLERYFNKIFNFDDENNLKENYYNYRKIFECYGVLCDAKQQEEIIKTEFESAEKEIAKLQKSQERLYNKGAKFEYSRYIIFNDIDENFDKIEKHLNKVAEDVRKNSDELKELGDMFVQTVTNYNQKRVSLKEAIEKKEQAQRDYDEVYLKAENCYREIHNDILSNAKDFINSDNRDIKKELQETFEENGKKERNQFDPDVILNTINKSIDIYKIELDVYLTGYDKISKLFEEIESDFVKNDKHLKFYKDSEAKIEFINAEKEYIVQFLDNERIGAIYDKKVHRKLMLEACKKFALDFEQIDKLYEIITKEMAGRSTKKIYKENYNKLYLIELEKSSVEPNLDTGKMRQDAIAFMNLNYWRVEGIRNIYEKFENIVTKIYEKDLTEFIPEQVEEKKIEENVEEDVEEIANNIDDFNENIENDDFETEFDTENDNDFEVNEIAENVQKIEQIKEETFKEETKKKKHKKVHRIYYSSKKQLARAIYCSLQNIEFAKNRENIIEELETDDDEQYSVPEDVEEILKNVQEEKIEENEDDFKNLEENFDLSKLDEIEYEDDNITSEEVENTEEYEEDEDSILDSYFKDEKDNDSTKKLENVKGAHFEKRAGIFQKLVGLNAKKKREA